MSSRIIVSVTNDLSSDQRVHKVCTTLCELGCSVLLVGRILKDSSIIERDYETHRIKFFFNRGPLFYIEYNIRLFFYLIFSNHDILISNDLDTLLANHLASKIRRSNLLYDSHELFSDVPELQSRPFIRSVWKCLESWLLPKQKNSYTVSESISEFYYNNYGVKMKVVRNVPFHNFSEAKMLNNKTLIYQGSINPGRGLELAISSMRYLEEYKLLIVGDGDGLANLIQLTHELKLDSQVEFVGRVPYEKLALYTQRASIGLLLEEPLGLSFTYSLPNKLFDYIHAELPFIASDLIEVKKIVNEYDVGEILKERTPLGLAKQIESLSMISRTKYKRAKEILCWEQEQIILKDIIRPLLK